MRAPRDSYTHKREPHPRTPKTKRCVRCKQRKSIAECFHRHGDGYRGICKTCRRKTYLRHRRSTPSVCASCGDATEGRRYCEPCRTAKQAQAERAFEDSSPPAPSVCGLPRHGKQCQEVVSDTCDREGRGVMYCPVHGYRVAPVIRPTNFVRYDQRARLDEDLDAYVNRAQAEVDPVMSERNRGSSHRGKNFVVGEAHGAAYKNRSAA